MAIVAGAVIVAVGYSTRAAAPIAGTSSKDVPAQLGPYDGSADPYPESDPAPADSWGVDEPTRTPPDPKNPQLRDLDARVQPVAVQATQGRIIDPRSKVVPVPTGILWLRVEVASSTPATKALVHLTTTKDGLWYALDARYPGVSLPWAAKAFISDATQKYFRVDATPESKTTHIQCRVYADNVLVAVNTGTGTVSCLPDLSKWS